MGFQRMSSAEWEHEHIKMMRWAKKTDFGRFAGGNAFSESNAKDQEDKLENAASMDKSREAWKPANPWEKNLDDWAGAGIIWAHICEGTDPWMHELLVAWTNANLKTNLFAVMWKELCLA